MESDSSELEMEVNYLTGHLLTSQSISTNLDLLLGFELGYFWNEKTKIRICIESDCESDAEEFDSDDWKDMDGNMIDYGFLIGGRAPISENISINGTYYYGLADIITEVEINNKSYQIYF